MTDFLALANHFAIYCPILVDKKIISAHVVSSIGLLHNAVIGYYCQSEFLDYRPLKTQPST